MSSHLFNVPSYIMILKIRYFINHDFVIHFLYVLLVNYLFDTQSTYLFRFMYFNKMPWNRKLCGTYHATHLNVNFILFLIGISFWNYQMLSCHQVYFDQVYRVTFFWLRNKIVQIPYKQMQAFSWLFFALLKTVSKILSAFLCSANFRPHPAAELLRGCLLSPFTSTPK